MVQLKAPRFHLGQISATPGAIRVLHEAGVNAWSLLARHVSGDWGDCCNDDRQANEDALFHGYRILSAYTLASCERVWIITEADRSLSTLLLPEEY